MQLIPVLDVRDGIAVSADGGDRSRYRPVRSVLADGYDPRAIGRAFRERLGLERLYLAELDAIASNGTELARALELVAELAREGSGVWVDAGVESAEGVESLLEAGSARVVIGLETLSRPAVLRILAAEFGSERLALSLDVRAAKPVARAPALTALAPERIALMALEAGFSTVIALDLDRVGSRTGCAVEWLARLRQAAPATQWLAGGGVRTVADLWAVAAAGYAGCLVGTALHEGSIGRREIETLAQGGAPPWRSGGGSGPNPA